MVVCGEVLRPPSLPAGGKFAISGRDPPYITSQSSLPALHYIAIHHLPPYIALHCPVLPYVTPTPPFQHYLASPRQVYFTLAQHASEEHTLL